MSKPTFYYLWAICICSVMAHAHDLFRGPHTHPRWWDMAVHIIMTCLTILGMVKIWLYRTKL